jgi:hypothetical protein
LIIARSAGEFGWTAASWIRSSSGPPRRLRRPPSSRLSRKPVRSPAIHYDCGERNKPRYSEQHEQRYQETHDPRYKKRKSSFLGELFDFGD